MSDNIEIIDGIRFYEAEDGSGLKPDRRRRDRTTDDPRIDHLFNGLDNMILTARENGNQYQVGYVQAMRKEFGMVVHDQLINSDRLLKALKETQQAWDVSQCRWCGSWGPEYRDSDQPSAYCHHEFTLTPFQSLEPLL